MRRESLAEESRWFTTHDAARALRMTPKGVRYLVADGKIACQRTPSRRCLFLASTILALEAKRAKARLVLVPAGVHHKDRATQQPHQLALFHVRLAIAPRAKEALPEREAKDGRSRGVLFGVR
jgi:hypothetical protein